MIDLTKTKPRIGTMAVGCRGYWSQFPGMKEYLCKKHGELISKFADAAEIAACGMVDGPESARAAAERFAAAGVDAVFCQAMTYATSDALVPAVKDLDVPVVLFNVQEEKKLDLSRVKTLDDWLGHGCTCAGIAELSAMLRRYGLRFDVVTGYLNGDEAVDDAIGKWVKAASVRRKMRTSGIGLLGRQYPGMMDLYVDENEVMKKFGMMTEFLMWEDVLKLSHEVTEDEAARYEREVRETFEIPRGKVSDADIKNIAVMYGAYEKLIERKKLAILANHFERAAVGEENELMAALNPAHTLLQKKGIACTVEGDIKGALAMLILKTIAGNANLTELYSMDFDDDICLIGHSGASDPCFASKKPVLEMATMFHGKDGKGFTTQAVPEAGPLTMLAITMRANGSFKMIAAEGMIEEGEVLNLGDTNCRARFQLPMREFVNQWSMHGPSHHGVMAKGHHIDALGAAAKVLDIDLEVVVRN